jgi:hypothetical protein
MSAIYYASLRVNIKDSPDPFFSSALAAAWDEDHE